MGSIIAAVVLLIAEGVIGAGVVYLLIVLAFLKSWH
jgi:hypothetical protein